MINKKYKNISIYISFFLFILISYIFKFSFGKIVFKNFYTFSKSMISFIPAVFILIGIFEVWVKKELIIKHMGEKSSYKGYLWAILLAGTAVGSLYMALPLSYSLQKKGARLSVIFTYIGAATVAKIPMTLYEASYLGIKFSIIRLAIAIPFLILSGMLFEYFLKKINYKIQSPEEI